MASPNHPTCCVLLVNYNHGAYLSQALDAVLGQTVPFAEIIIIDDASTDNSVEIITRRIQGVSQAKLLVNPVNMGVIRTVNLGIKEATADFVFFMSADDSYSLQMMEWCRVTLAQYPDVAMVSGNVCICNIENGTERLFILPFPQETARYSPKDLEAVAKKRVVTFYGGANLIRRDAMIKAGGYLAPLEWHADWFLYLLMACRYPFAVVPHEFIRIRQSSDQYSHACYDWTKQKPVIEAFVRALKENYPDDYAFFRDNALLPTYDIEALFMLWKNSELRGYLTPLLVWRLLSYKSLRWVAQLVPEHFRAGLRKLVRV